MNNLNNLNTLNYFSKQPTDSIYYAGTGASLDLNFARNKSLIDRISGNNLITFTRTSSGTFVDSAGVIINAATNLLLRSEEIDNTGVWPQTGLTVSANNAIAPNGTLTADTITVISGTPIIYQDLACSASTIYTFSFYIKLGTMPASDFRFAVRDNTNAVFIDTDIVPNITPVSTEWRRVVYTFTTPVGCISVRPYLYRFSFSTGGTVQLWGAQLEQSSTVGEYVPTTTIINSAPRFDHNPTTRESLGLLVEEQRTNLLLNSEEFNNANWESTPGARTVTSNNIVAPNGLTTADTITADGTTNAHFVSQSLTLSAISYSYSVFAKAGTNDFLQLRTFSSFGGMWANFNLATGVVGTVGVVSGATPTASIQAYPNGWYRCTMIFTPTAATSSVAIYIVNSASAGGGAANSLSTTVHLWGAQLEAGAFFTSYIPTITATVTRNSDVANITGTNFSGWYNQSEGTMYIQGVMAPVLSRFPSEWSLNDGTANNQLLSYNFTTGYYVSIRKTGETTTDPALTSTTPTSGTNYKKAVAIKSADYRVGAQGQQGTSTNPAFIPTVNQLRIGSNQGGIAVSNSTISRITYFPQRISNANLQRITQ